MMTAEKISKIIDYVFRILMLSLVFLVPVYFAVIFQDNSVFALSKTVIFRTLVELSVLVVAVRFAIEKKLFLFIDKKAFLIILLFFVLLTIAFIFSIDYHNSFWGSYWRQNGLFTNLHYLLFIFLLALYLNNNKKIKGIINVLLIASAIIAIYGIIQWLGYDLFIWSKSSFFGKRATSTMGQPVFLANFLLFVIFLTVYKIFEVKKSCGKIVLALLLLLQLLCLLFTSTRGAILGLLAGIIFYLFLRFFTDQACRKKLIFFALFIFVISTSLIITANLVFLDNIENRYLRISLSRVKEVTDLRAGSLAMRFKYWTGALDAISRRPFFGYGLDNQKEILTGYYDPEWSVYESINSVPDRVHNELLDITLSCGLLVLLSYLLLLGYIFVKGTQYYVKKARNRNSLMLYLLLGLFSYQVALLTSFSVIETNICFYLFLVVILVIINDFKAREVISIKKGNRQSYFIIPLGLVLLVFIISYSLFFQIKELKADYYFREARLNFSKMNYQEMFNKYISAMRHNPSEEYYQWFFVSDALQSLTNINSENYRKSVLTFMQTIVDKSIMKNRNYSRLFMQAKYYKMMGKYMDKSYFKLAAESYNGLININPFIPDAYLDWADMYIQAKDYQKAIIISQVALSVLPDINNPYLNDDHRPKIINYSLKIHDKIAYSYYMIEDYDNSIDHYKRIISANPYNPNAYRMLSLLYKLKADNEKATWFNNRRIMLGY